MRIESMIDSTTGEVRDAEVHGETTPALPGVTDRGFNASATMTTVCDKLHDGWLFW